MNNQEKGCICLIISFILIIFLGGDFYMRKIINDSFMVPSAIIKYSFDLIVEKYIFYGIIISAQIGYFYLYGDIDRDFNNIIIMTTFLILVMDIQGIINLIGFINNAIYILINSVS